MADNPFADLIPGNKQASGPISLTPPKVSAKRMTPDEVAAEGLDPGTVYYRGENGVPTPVGGQSDGASSKPPTEFQSKSAGFYGRMLRANNTWATIADDDKGPRGVIRQSFHDTFPDLENSWMNSNQRQAADQNVNDFISATLRQESGAAINKDEFDKQYRIFFPMPGDGPDVIKQKAIARKQAIDGFRIAAGPLAADIEKGVATRGDAPNGDQQNQPPANNGAPLAQGSPPAGGGSPVKVDPGPIDPDGIGDIGFNNGAEASALPPGAQEFQRRFEHALRSGEIPADPYAIIGWVKEHGTGIGPAGALITMDEARKAAEQMKKGIRPSVATPQYQVPDISDLRGQGGAGETADAFVRGAGEVFPFTNQISAAVNTVTGDKPFSENMNRELVIDKYDEENHPYARIGGTVAGAFAIPTGVRSAAVKEATAALRAGATREQAIAAARRIIPIQLAKEGAAYGGAYGAGQSRSLSELPGNAIEGAITGGVTGGVVGKAGTTGSQMIDTLSQRFAPQIDQAAVEAAQAAEGLGIDLPKFVVGGPKARSDAAALEQSPFGVNQISEATNKMLDQAEAARSKIADTVGQAVEPEAMGEVAVAGAAKSAKAERARVGKIYDAARKESDNTPFLATDTKRVFREIVDAENEGLGTSKVGAIIDDMANDLSAKQGRLTIDGARDTRSRLRTRLRTEAELTPDNADRITNMVMDAIGTDLERGLKAAGKGNAIPLYRKADAAWSALRTTEDDVLKPYIGKDGDAWGADAAKRIAQDAKGNGVRLAQFLNAVPEDTANTVRASLIMRLGHSRPGSQDAAGEAFSLDTFLTNWNEIKASRNLIFPKETVQLLDGLASVADVAKVAGRSKGHSNTGRSVWKALTSAPGMAGLGGSLVTTDPKYMVAGVTVAGLSGLKQWNAARLLSSPEFARKLAGTPLNAKAAQGYWSRPWVGTLAKASPEIGREVMDFQKSVLRALNDNSAISAAASNQDGEQGQ